MLYRVGASDSSFVCSFILSFMYSFCFKFYHLSLIPSSIVSINSLISISIHSFPYMIVIFTDNFFPPLLSVEATNQNYIIQSIAKPMSHLSDARRQQQQQQQRLVSSQGPFQAAERARATKKQSAEAEGKRLELMKLEARKKTERNQSKTDLNAEQLRAKRLQFLGMQ